MSTNRTKEINDLNDFQEGIFKIERNGKIITLTKEEIEQFKFLDTALKGREELMADNIFILQENGPNSKAMEIVWIWCGELRQAEALCLTKMASLNYHIHCLGVMNTPLSSLLKS